MPRIFICYRRDDTSGHAGRLHETLVREFGDPNVFFDIGTIRPGEDWAEVISHYVDESDVMLVVIGKRWLGPRDATRQQRLFNPHDFVRMEIQTALERNIRVIPVLVQGVQPPAPHRLPAEIALLTRRQAVELTDSRWGYDVSQLIEALKRIPERAPGQFVAHGLPDFEFPTNARPPQPVLAIDLGHTNTVMAVLRNGEPVIVENGQGKRLTPTTRELVPLFKKLKEDALMRLEEQLDSAVLAVPAYYDDRQRSHAHAAATNAGLKVRGVINHPEAALWAYRLTHVSTRVAVVHVGGATCDCTVLGSRTIANRHNNFIGGAAFTQRLVDWIVSEFESRENINLEHDVMAMQRITQAAEEAKTQLSTTDDARIELPFLTAFDGNPKHLGLRLTRSKLEDLCSDLLKRVQAVALDARLAVSGIDEAIAIGGQTRSPAVLGAIARGLGKQPRVEIDPQEAVALGAALYAGSLSVAK